MMCSKLQSVGHKLLDVAWLCLAVCYREYCRGILGLDVLHEVLDIFSFGGNAPYLCDIVSRVDYLPVSVAGDHVSPGVTLAVTAEIGVEVGGFHIKADNILSLARLHCAADKSYLLNELICRCAEIEGGKNVGYAVLHKSCRSLNGILVEEGLAVGVCMYIDQSGADISALHIHDLCAIGGNLLTEVGDLTVLDYEGGVADNIIGHYKICVYKSFFHYNKPHFSLFYRIFYTVWGSFRCAF